MTKVTKNTLGGRLRELRGDLKQMELAEILQIKQAMISRYEANIETPSPRNLLKISKFANRPVEWLLLGQDFASASLLDITVVPKNILPYKEELLEAAAYALRRTGDPEIQEFSKMMLAFFHNAQLRKRLLDYYKFSRAQGSKKKAR